MGGAAKLTGDDIKAIADAVLGSEMADLGFEGVAVRHREIYPDEPSLFVRAKVAEEVRLPSTRGASATCTGFSTTRSWRVERSGFPISASIGPATYLQTLTPSWANCES